jgi:hypothetical protein
VARFSCSWSCIISGFPITHCPEAHPCHSSKTALAARKSIVSNPSVKLS